jgi:NAD(P)H dehydrogenase (quinone)
MILITGASGKTGRAITQMVKHTGVAVRAMVHNAAQAPQLQAAGASEVLVGDLQSRNDLDKACKGIQSVYHICPNMHPQEVEIAQKLLEAAAQAGVEHFVYHSVFHPQIEAMPHHWNKMRVEEMVFSSDLLYTILQPCAYMQNVLGYWQQITTQGIYPVPYSVNTRLSLVDLEDVAKVAAMVLVDPGHDNAIYELCGPETISQAEVAVDLSRELGKAVRAETISLSEWEKGARNSGMIDYARQTLIKMFEYYDRYGLVGNPTVLAWLLKRQPTSFAEFIHREWVGRTTTPIQ